MSATGQNDKYKIQDITPEQCLPVARLHRCSTADE